MIKNFKDFKEINESNFKAIKDKYNSLGEYVEYLYNQVDDKNGFEQLLGRYLKIDKKKYNTKTYKEGDYILMEYWYNDIITPVKIIEKKGGKYEITHNIEDSSIKNAPNEVITKDRIIDFYKKTFDNKQEKNIDTDLRISKAVNLLKPYDQMVLVNKLQDRFKVDEKVTFELEEYNDLTLLGKTGFNSFIKVVSALSLPTIERNKENCPNDFFIMFMSEKLNNERLFSKMKRFRSMKQIIEILKDNSEPLRIYFGLKFNNKLFMEYGFIKGENRMMLGEFKLTKYTFDKLKSVEKKPLKDLQKQVENLDIKELKKLMMIKIKLTEFSPGYYVEKSNCYVEDGMLHQGYYGVGKWDSGLMTRNSLDNFKEEFKKWIAGEKWGKDILFNIKPDNFWVWVKIKLKNG
jgi:hypothetical protein